MAKKRNKKQKKITLIRSRKTRLINKIKKLDLGLISDRRAAREYSEKIMLFNNQLNELGGNIEIKKITIDDNLTETELGHAWEVGKIIDYLQDLNIDKLNNIDVRLHPHKLIDLVYKYINTMTSKDILNLHLDEDENIGYISL